MDTAVAHDISAKERTADVRVKEVSPFSKMLLTEAVRRGLQQAGFVYPTIIQATAIPVGKSGLDLLVQSKSGTGKTLIFSTILLEAYRSEVREPQSLIVVPTREIAVQIEGVLNQIGRYCPGFRAVCVIGGLDIADDRKNLQSAKAVVGTPGRLLHLIQNEVLNTSRIRLLILDEADKMYTQSFRQDLQRIQRALPSKRQTIACSATFIDNLDKEVAKIMKNPLLISTEERATLLIGIKQFVYELVEQKTSILEMGAKLDALKNIFGRISFKQCLIFAGSQSRADSYRNYLEKEGWPCELISGAQDQKTRLETFRKFREFKTRILIATDLMSRGIDSEYVNLVINLELPTDVVTYLHRIGRAGRFGSHGIAISFLASEKDRTVFRRLISQVGGGMNVLKFQPQAMLKEDELDVWDFSDFGAECKHYGCFSNNEQLLAPLASQDKDSFSDSQENKENQSNNANVEETNSSIDTKTFEVDSTGVGLNLLDLLVDRPEYNTQAAQKLTPESRQSSSQRLPSSNTIDDASSIAADSVRSSQQDISRYQSILMQKAAIPTLVEFLVDPKSEAAGKAEGVTKKPQIDLFDDYKNAVQQIEEEESASLSVATKPAAKILNKNLKSLLIDRPATNQKATTTNKDIYSDYANFEGDEASSSISQTTTAASEDIDKATFILSVATPSQARESIESMQNSSLDLSQVTAMSDTQSLPEIRHFTSPAHNQPPESNSIPDVVPETARIGLPMKFTVNVGAQVEIAPYLASANSLSPQPPPPSASPLLDDLEDYTTSSVGSSDHHDAAESVGHSSTERGGGSSGFDEQTSSSSSSGIATSEQGAEDDNDDDEDDAYGYDNEYSSSNYEEDEEDDDDDETYFETDDENEVTMENVYETSDDDDEYSVAKEQQTHKVADAANVRISDAEESSEEAAGNSMPNNIKQEHNIKQRTSKARQATAPTNPSDDYDVAYQAAYKRWVELYWTQLRFLQNHVKFSTNMRQQQE